MKTCPKIGEFVEFLGNCAIGPCLGYVEHIYRTYEFDYVNDRETNIPLPEREWHVRMRPDVLPAQWPYAGSQVFAPEVNELRKARKRRRTTASREEQRARYLDCGPAAWDDR